MAASAAVAIAMNVFKGQANDSAAQTYDQVNGAGLGCDPARGLSTNDPRYAEFVSSCNAYDNDISNVNTDATIGNIALGVGIAALAGTVIYWFVGDRTEKTGPEGHASLRPP